MILRLVGNNKISFETLSALVQYPLYLKELKSFYLKTASSDLRQIYKPESRFAYLYYAKLWVELHAFSEANMVDCRCFLLSNNKLSVNNINHTYKDIDLNVFIDNVNCRFSANDITIRSIDKFLNFADNNLKWFNKVLKLSYK